MKAQQTQDTMAIEILATNIGCEVREADRRSLLLLSEPLNTNGGDYTAQESWAAVVSLMEDGGIRIVVNQDGLWLSRDPEQLNDGITFLELVPKKG